MSARGTIAARRGISDADLEKYRTHGFCYLHDVIPRSLRQDCQRIIELWVDFQIEAWRKDGLIDRDFRELDFWHRMNAAWVSAGKPRFRRRPNHFLITPEMYAVFKNRALLDIAERVLGTTEISVHGIFNTRPQFPNAPDWNNSPWHQDSQYWHLDYGTPEPDLERKTHVVTVWFPLQAVDAGNGALQFISVTETENRIFEPYDYDWKNTGFLGISPDEVKKYSPVCEPMAAGDAVIIGQRAPHAACPNTAKRTRWSVDVRYEATATATVLGQKFGFVVQSCENPASETPLEEWLRKRQ